MQCPNCGSNNTNHNAIFCAKCAHIIDDKGFQNKDALNAAQSHLKSFIQTLENESAKSSFTSPIAQLQGLFDNVAKLKAFLKVFSEHAQGAESSAHARADSAHSQEHAPIKRFIAECESFLQRDNSFHIAFAGTINAGKSTLINALLKGEYASMSVTPETAVLTKFQHGDSDKIEVSFYNENEWSEFFASAKKAGGVFLEEYNKNNAESFKSQWVGQATITESLNAETLKKYTSSKSPSHYFAKEVKISLQNFPFAKNIVFVDTPGLDDAVAYRSNVTREYIKRANAVLLCVESSALTGNETNTIYRIFDNTGGKPEKVYVLGTKYERLNEPQKEWEAQKAEWSKYLVSGREKDMTKFSASLADKNIFAVSGYIAFLLALHERGELDEGAKKQLKVLAFKLCDEQDFTRCIKQLQDFSNISYIFTRIHEDILDKAEQEVIADTQTAYKFLHEEISRYFNESLQGMNEGFEASQQGIEAINAKIKKEEERLQVLEKEREELEQVAKQFDKDIESTIKELSSEIDKILQEIA